MAEGAGEGAQADLNLPARLQGCGLRLWIMGEGDPPGGTANTADGKADQAAPEQRQPITPITAIATEQKMGGNDQGNGGGHEGQRTPETQRSGGNHGRSGTCSLLSPDRSVLLQPSGGITGVISEDQIGTGTLEAEKGFQHHSPLIDPTALSGRLHH